MLAKVCDPTFVGFSKIENQDISCKYVSKRNAEEKVGVHVRRNNEPHIIGNELFNRIF